MLEKVINRTAMERALDRGLTKKSIFTLLVRAYLLCDERERALEAFDEARAQGMAGIRCCSRFFFCLPKKKIFFLF